MWGDFHSFKNKAALEFETFHMLALGAKCMVGDQLEPNGKLSAPVYDLIGSIYREIEKKEPWCVDAEPLSEIGVFTPEEFQGAGGGDLPAALQGAIRMLQESAHQFDVIDSASDLSRYKVVILPDEIPVDEALETKLESYVQNGGAIIASFESGMNREQDRFQLPNLDIRLLSEQTTDIYGELVRGKHYYRSDYAEYVLPKGAIGKGLPETEHVMYSKGVEVTAGQGTEVIAETILPTFNRTYQQFCSHRHAPSSGKVGSDAILRSGQSIYFAHPIFNQYNKNAPRWCKTLLLNAIELLIGQPLLSHNGPSSLLATVNRQPEEQRHIVHLLHYIPERRSIDIDIIEDVIPLYNLALSIEFSGQVASVKCVPEGRDLDFSVQDGRLTFTVPEIHGHQMIAIT